MAQEVRSIVPQLAAQGKTLAQTHRGTLAAIAQRFGVPASVILAIWGRETAFGTYKLPKNAISASAILMSASLSRSIS